MLGRWACARHNTAAPGAGDLTTHAPRAFGVHPAGALMNRRATLPGRVVCAALSAAERARDEPSPRPTCANIEMSGRATGRALPGAEHHPSAKTTQGPSFSTPPRPARLRSGGSASTLRGVGRSASQLDDRSTLAKNDWVGERSSPLGQPAEGERGGSIGRAEGIAAPLRPDVRVGLLGTSRRAPDDSGAIQFERWGDASRTCRGAAPKPAGALDGGWSAFTRW
jgi:hypothetical protein